MKLITGLSTAAMISLANISPGFAIDQSTHRSSSSNQTDRTLVAGDINLRGVINRLVRNSTRKKPVQRPKAIRVEQPLNSIQIQPSGYQQFQTERQKQRQAAIERERIYFNSLTPEQQKAYIARKKAQEAAGAALLLQLFGAAMMGGGQSTPSQPSYDYIYGNQSPTYQPTPQPVQPIDSFYGTGPGGSFYGNK